MRAKRLKCGLFACLFVIIPYFRMRQPQSVTSDHPSKLINSCV